MISISITKIMVFTALFQLCFISTLDYCKICKKGTHTLCKYPEGPSIKCARYRKTDLSRTTKKYILEVHNDIRNHIASGQETKGALGRQPPAANMNILQWDNELEEMAQRWADQCIQLTQDNQHDVCRLTERFDVGQNVLTAVTSSLELPDLAILILNWYKQVNNVIPSDIELFAGIQRGKYLIGQYTQLVWAETRYVGCGISSFQDTNNTSEPLQYLHRLVCNYGPRGNVIGSSVYEKGIPCSKCPFGRCDSIRSNLCEVAELVKDSILGHNVTVLTRSYFKQLKNNSNTFIKNTSRLQENETVPFISYNFSETQIYDHPRVYIDRFKSHERHFGGHVKQTVDILNMNDYYYNNIISIGLYEIEDGNVIVDDCKKHPHLSQFEVSDAQLRSMKHLDVQEISLLNGMIFKKEKGIWFHGRCRCNYIYRSNTSQLSYEPSLGLSLLLLILAPQVILNL